MSRDRSTEEALSPVKQALAEIRRLKRELARATSGVAEPVAVVGMGIRLPGVGSDVDRLHGFLCDGVDAIGELPADRWDVAAYYDPDPQAPGKMYTLKGGFLEDVRGFDPEFFGISPFEAATIDPQHRLMLEVTWEALENAAISPESIRGSRTGVFLGISGNDYSRLSYADPNSVDAYAGVGTTLSVSAGRIAYTLDLRGPAVAIDTACSSSLVAACAALRSLESGESNLALVGGVNLMLSPEVTINFCKAQMLSQGGRCKTFDDDADGYVRSEGCVVVVLKRLADAQRDGDRIHAVIRGGAINQDGRSSGITAPNGPSQEAVIRAALANAGVEADRIGYVEAHGTGTSLGDPIELNALGAVFRDRSPDEPLWVGSAKTNFGHLEAAAGLLGLVKVVEALRHGELHPHIHFAKPNAHVSWSELPISIPTERVPFAPRGATRLAGVSSFGFSGTNVHVVLEEPPRPTSSTSNGSGERETMALPISADREAALRDLAERYVHFLDESDDSLADICYTAGIGRAHFSERIAVVASDKREAREALVSWLERGSHERVVSSGTDDDGGTDLTHRYVGGETIDWAALHAGQDRRRVALPTYPFQRRPYWLPERETTVAPVAATQEGSEQDGTELSPFDAVVAAATQRAAVAPLEMNIGSYAEKWSLLRQLTATLGHNLLIARGALADGEIRDLDAILSQCGIKPLYRQIVERWLDAMAAAGTISRSSDGWKAEAPPAAIDDAVVWQQVEAALQDNKPMLRYIRNCARHLEGVLTGSVSPLETLFPDGSFDLAVELYEQSTQIRYINGIAASVLDTWIRHRLPRGQVRVLEIGAGTGGTTSSLLPVLPAARTIYDYTDLTDIFLDFSRERFPDASFIRTRHFNMEQEIEEQGFEAASYDIVTAANVVHAARDLRAALRHIRTLLAPGGLLLLVESTGHLEWHDITTGLIEGWQHFEDDLRTDTPLLDVQQWRHVLDEEGFVEVGASPSADSPADLLAQHVIFAVAPGEPVARSEVADAREVAHATPSGNEDRISPDTGAGNGAFLSSLAAAVASEREQIAANAVRDRVIEVLRADPERPPSVDARLMELGLDSLMAVRLRNSLEETLGLPFSLPSTLMFDYPTVRHIARLILERLADDDAAAAEAADTGAAAASDAGEGRRAAEIADLSEEEVEALIANRLDAGEGQ